MPKNLVERGKVQSCSFFSDYPFLAAFTWLSYMYCRYGVKLKKNQTNQSIDTISSNV